VHPIHPPRSLSLPMAAPRAMRLPACACRGVDDADVGKQARSHAGPCERGGCAHVRVTGRAARPTRSERRPPTTFQKKLQLMLLRDDAQGAESDSRARGRSSSPDSGASQDVTVEIRDGARPCFGVIRDGETFVGALVWVGEPTRICVHDVDRWMRLRSGLRSESAIYAQFGDSDLS
jgi:hypothetical protein